MPILQFDPNTFNTGSPTDAASKTARTLKRLIICCDGTWQDGLLVQNRWQFTNILRLSRCIDGEDTRHDPPIPQIVYYQCGIGSDPNFYSYLQGTTGASLGEKVQEAYAFLAQNYQPGDEIFLFGFSRGAYTARMVAGFISAIGILNRCDMSQFATIFVNFQKRGKTKDKAAIEDLDKKLQPWTSPDAPGKRRVTSASTPFSVKCVGVFDTVGSLGLPEEISLHWKATTTIFGFPDKTLSPDIANAFQALAINETRVDFNCCKFEQTEEGRKRNQVVKQCWFTGSHSDVGGGWQDHDLSDLTLTWMASQIGHLLSLDLTYLASLPEPVAPWGHQHPHNPETGIFTLAHAVTRQLPTSESDVTREIFHPSVLSQSNICPMPGLDIAAHPELVHELTPLEKQLRDNWPYDPNSEAVKSYQARIKTENKEPTTLEKIAKISESASHVFIEKALETVTMTSQGGHPVYQKTWLAKMSEETHLGPYLKAFESEN